MTSASSLISLVTVAIHHVGGQAYAYWHMEFNTIHSASESQMWTRRELKVGGKLDPVNGIDPYEIEWQDNVNLWAMYLILSQSP